MNIQTLKAYFTAKKLVFLFFVSVFFLFSCDKENKTLNLFSVQDDMQFGKEFDAQILASSEFIILDENQYKEAYSYLNKYKDKLLATGEIAYSNQFNWTVRIVKDDATVNAFAVPGGYLYFYTGLINLLDNEAEFVGVMAHEMAHIACRHSTKQLTKAYGVDLMLSMLLGKNQNQWVQIASELTSGLLALQFSRDDEYEADKYAVKYTYPTDWDARGIGNFFEKMESHSSIPAFLSTHPSDEQRAKKINKEWTKLGGKQGNNFTEDYNLFKSSLL